MLAFHNDKKIKDKYVARVKAHAKADVIVKGQYWQDGKGCAVGCTIEGREHLKYETELGIPATIAYLEDQLFEGLPNKKAMKFPLQFLQAIPVGADLSLVTPKFMVWMLKDVKKYAKGHNEVLNSCDTVIGLYQRIIGGGVVTDTEWNEAETAARAAWAAMVVWRGRTVEAAWAAWVARASVKAVEARAAARAAEEAVRAAAWSAEEKQYEKMAKKLIKLLKEAPVTD